MYFVATEHMGSDDRDEFDASLNPPPPKPMDERFRERIEAIAAAGGEVTT